MLCLFGGDKVHLLDEVPIRASHLIPESQYRGPSRATRFELLDPLQPHGKGPHRGRSSDGCHRSPELDPLSFEPRPTPYDTGKAVSEFTIHLTKSSVWGYKPPIPLRCIADGLSSFPAESHTQQTGPHLRTFSLTHPYDYCDTDVAPFAFQVFQMPQHQPHSPHDAFLYDIPWVMESRLTGNHSAESTPRPKNLELHRRPLEKHFQEEG